MGLWAYIISQTSASPARLLAFGGLCLGASFGVGYVFSELMTPPGTSRPLDSQTAASLGYEERVGAHCMVWRVVGACGTGITLGHDQLRFTQQTCVTLGQLRFTQV
jgi:hypothetical protein